MLGLRPVLISSWEACNAGGGGGGGRSICQLLWDMAADAGGFGLCLGVKQHLVLRCYGVALMTCCMAVRRLDLAGWKPDIELQAVTMRASCGLRSADKGWTAMQERHSMWQAPCMQLGILAQSQFYH